MRNALRLRTESRIRFPSRRRLITPDVSSGSTRAGTERRPIWQARSACWRGPSWAAGSGKALRTAWNLVGQTSNRVSASMDDEPRDERTGEVHRIPRPDGSELQVECYGPADAPPVILTHGWGANSTEWYYPKKHLADRFRLIVWDEPGLGLSKKPDNNDYRLEKLRGRPRGRARLRRRPARRARRPQHRRDDHC